MGPPLNWIQSKCKGIPDRILEVYLRPLSMCHWNLNDKLYKTQDWSHDGFGTGGLMVSFKIQFVKKGIMFPN